MTLYKWSQTAAADATADSTINWAEGQAPSSINDSARAMMAATAKYRDDIAGAIVTSGSSTAYTVASYELFDSLVHLHGQMIAFTPHVTNGATVTLNVDSLGARPLRSAPNAELPAGTIIQGTPYVATYNNTDGAFYLHNFFGNPYNVPIGAGMDYWGSTAPNSAFAFPAGQTLSRSTYAALFGIIGTIYGNGDGSGATFSLPDKRGRTSAALDNMGGSAASRLTATYFGQSSGFAAVALGAWGGLEYHALTIAEMPSHFHTAIISDPGHSHQTDRAASVEANATIVTSSNPTYVTPNNANTAPALTGVRVNSSNGADTTGSAGSGASHAIVQPTIVCNYIIRVL
jgi:microcystin-dependent protein